MTNLVFWLFFASELIGEVFLLGYTTLNLTGQSSNGDLRECKQVIKSEYAVIHSPNYPFLYPRFTNCQYVLEQYSPTFCEVRLTLHVFEVARMISTNCSEDYLELQDMHKRYRICGDLPPGSMKFLKFPLNSNQLVLDFRSTFYQKNGFEIEVKQIPHSCSWRTTTTEAPPRIATTCNRSVEGRVGRIVFPESGTFSNQCTYTIHRSEPRACLLRMDFIDFDITSTAGCDPDHILLPDGQKLCGVLGGIQKFLQFPSKMDELTIISVGSNNRFNIQLMQLPGPCDSGALITNQTENPMNQCDQTIRTSLGTLSSPGHPAAFGPNYHCVYRIYRPDVSVCSIELDFVEFSVGKHNPASCSTGAYLELPGNNRLCHDISGKMIISVSEFQDPVILEFHSDSSSSGKGFHIEVIQVSNTCPGFEVHSQIAKILVPRCFQEVPFYSGHFSPPPMTSTCEFLVRRADPTVCRVRLQVSSRTFLTVPCTHNFIQLPDGDRMCVSLSERREVQFPEGSTFMTLDYSSWHFPEFNLFVEQLRNSCKVRRSPLFSAKNSRWAWRIIPR